MISCVNCSADNQNEHQYCHHCGQKLNEKLTMSVLFSASIANYFSIDSSLKKSIIPLLFKPGEIAKKFVQGKRTSYIHPAKFYLFTSFIFFVLIGFVSKDNMLKSVPVDTEAPVSDSLFVKKDTITQDLNTNYNTYKDKNGIETEDISINLDPNKFLNQGFLSERITGGLKKLENNELNLLESFLSRLPIAIILSVPIFALFLLLILYKQKQKYSVHLVFSLYYFTFSFIIWSLYFCIEKILFNDLDSYLMILLILGIWLYLCTGIRRFYEISWKKSIGVSIIQSIFYLGLILPITVISLVILALAFG